MQMKIALVHDILIKYGGAERVLELLHAIYPSAPIYTLLYDAKGTKNVFSDPAYKINQSNLSKLPKFLKNHSKLLLPYFPKAIEEFDLSQYDIVISNSNSFAHGVITKPTTLHICYCHSPIRYVWDWHSEYIKENHFDKGLVSLYIKKILSEIRIWDYYASSRPDIWIANSKNVQKRIEKYYRLSSTIIYPSTKLFAKEVDTKFDDYYLIISRLSPYKKIDLAISAFNKNKKKLIIIGEGNDLYRLKNMANKNIKFLGYQNNESVSHYLSNCKALIFPGEEDFGLTPIEAMSYGKSVIAYKKGGVTETVIDKQTGVFFDQADSCSLKQAINYFEKNLNAFSAHKCRDRANEFSEQVFIQKFKSQVELFYKNFTNENNSR